MVCDMTISQLKIQIQNDIPKIIDMHLKKMTQYPEFCTFLNNHPSYANNLSQTMHDYCLAMFYFENDYHNFIAQEDIGAYHLGTAYATETTLTSELVFIMNHSTRMAASHYIGIALESMGEEAFTLARLIERLFELFNTRQVSFIKGYIEKQTEKLKLMSQTDPLTGAYNRRYFYQVVRDLLTQASLDQCPLTLVLVDLNNFKSINDTIGHQCGDRVLENFASLVNTHLANHDLLFRFGGDEFVLLLTDSDETFAIETVLKINTALQNNEPKLSLSFGCIELPTHPSTENFNIEDYLKRVDERMYAYKKEHSPNVV